MFKTLLPCFKKYKKETILAPLMVIGEVVLEILIPLVMAKLIDEGIPSGDMGYVLKLGFLMLVMALVSLAFGALSGKYAAKSAAGSSRVNPPIIFM